MIYMGCPIKEGNPTERGRGRGTPGGELRDIGAPVATFLSSSSSAHSISFHCHPLIVSTASAGIMYIGRML